MGTPRYTRLVEVYDTLLDLIGAEPEINPRFLVDGLRSIEDYSDYLFMFGFRPNSDDPVTVDRAATGGLAANDIETITIGVLIAATDPSDNMRAARAKVAEKFGALERVVTRDPTIGLPGVKATIASHIWFPVHTTKGAECNTTVEVRIEVPL